MTEILILSLSGLFIGLVIIEWLSRVAAAKRWRNGRRHIVNAYRRLLK